MRRAHSGINRRSGWEAVSSSYVTVRGRTSPWRSLRVVTIAPYSDAYFALLKALPDLQDVATLEPAVLVAGRRASIKIGEGVRPAGRLVNWSDWCANSGAEATSARRHRRRVSQHLSALVRFLYRKVWTRGARRISRRRRSRGRWSIDRRIRADGYSWWQRTWRVTKRARPRARNATDLTEERA